MLPESAVRKAFSPHARQINAFQSLCLLSQIHCSQLRPHATPAQDSHPLLHATGVRRRHTAPRVAPPVTRAARSIARDPQINGCQTLSSPEMGVKTWEFQWFVAWIENVAFLLRGVSSHSSWHTHGIVGFLERASKIWCVCRSSELFTHSINELNRTLHDSVSRSKRCPKHRW